MLKKSISLQMATFLSMIFALSLGRAEDFAAAGDLLTDYETEWEISIDEPPTYALAGNDFFGVYNSYTSDEEMSIYKHYDNSGQLLWSSKMLGFSPLLVAMSESGSRVLLQHERKPITDYLRSTLEVFDENGRKLFTCPVGQGFLSSPNGAYFYSVWGSDDPAVTPLTVLDSLGFKRKMPSTFWTDARALDDSLLVCVNFSKLAIFNVFAFPVREISIEDLTRSGETGFLVGCSGERGRIALWNDHEVHIFDSELESLGDFTRESYIQGVKFSPDDDLIAYREMRLPSGSARRGQDYVLLAGYDGYIWAEATIDEPPGQIAGYGEAAYEWTRTDMSFSNGGVVWRFMSSPRYADKLYSGRSLVMLKEVTVFNSATIESRIFPLHDGSIIEIGESQAKKWTKSRGR